MNNQATIRPIQSPVMPLLTPEEKSIVDLISTAIVNKTFNNEKRNSLSKIQPGQTKCLKH